MFLLDVGLYRAYSPQLMCYTTSKDRFDGLISNIILMFLMTVSLKKFKFLSFYLRVTWDSDTWQRSVAAVVFLSCRITKHAGQQTEPDRFTFMIKRRTYFTDVEYILRMWMSEVERMLSRLLQLEPDSSVLIKRARVRYE